MAKEFVFLFYPGDYLRDTQCLSEPAQVAYDRIMCEHMRNICITQEQLNFFTKRLNAEQKAELMMVLTPGVGGFFIEWVVTSINKRREYSESRRKNREGTSSKKKKNISKSYVSHMEDEIEIVKEEVSTDKKESKIILPFGTTAFRTSWESWLTYRKQIKKPYRSEMSERTALKTLAKHDEQTAIQMIENSIANGWQGLFEIKTNGYESRRSITQASNGIKPFAGTGYGKPL